MIAAHSRSFLVPCPHYYPRFKMDLKSLEKPATPRVLNTLVVSTRQFEASAELVAFWTHCSTLPTKKPYLPRLVSSRHRRQICSGPVHTHQPWGRVRHHQLIRSLHLKTCASEGRCLYMSCPRMAVQPRTQDPTSLSPLPVLP